METIVGIFISRVAAGDAAARLRSLGIASDHINFLTPEMSKAEFEAVPTTEAEPRGVGPVLGGIVGGAAGTSLGLQLGAVAAAIAVPGIGTVAAIGALAAALLGVGGIAAGAAVGNALEKSSTQGVPKDELYIYKDALRQGRTIVLVVTEETTQAEAVRSALRQAGAESIDAASSDWSVGLHHPEAAVYSEDLKHENR
jgi:hypothetical protein